MPLKAFTATPIIIMIFLNTSLLEVNLVSEEKKGYIWLWRALLHHERGAVEEEMTEIQVVSGETTLILHIETYQL